MAGAANVLSPCINSNNQSGRSTDPKISSAAALECGGLPPLYAWRACSRPGWVSTVQPAGLLAVISATPSRLGCRKAAARHGGPHSKKTTAVSYTVALRLREVNENGMKTR